MKNYNEIVNFWVSRWNADVGNSMRAVSDSKLVDKMSLPDVRLLAVAICQDIVDLFNGHCLEALKLVESHCDWEHGLRKVQRFCNRSTGFVVPESGSEIHWSISAICWAGNLFDVENDISICLYYVDRYATLAYAQSEIKKIKNLRVGISRITKG